MFEFRHILVPIDLHEHSENLAGLALTMTSKLGAERTTFLHVMSHLPDLVDYDVNNLVGLESIFRAHAEGKMADFLQTLPGRTSNVAGVVVSGVTAEAILDYAREQHVDFIVIATHGTQGLEKVLLGSVADRVIKGAPCPTLVFNPFREERGYEVCRPLSSCVSAV